MRDLPHFYEEPTSSNSIIHRKSGRKLETLVLPASLAEARGLSGGWLFDWAREAARYAVFKLVTVEEPGIIQGLMSLEERQDFYHVYLVESAPFNRGREKEHEGAAGNLFAFACLKSNEKGFGGFVSFESKTELTAHYRETLGAKSIGNSNRMVIDEFQAQRLIQTYFSK
ncbi:MAG: hypothetical protein EPO28_00115 [Saprospiraceae bacterium]|nr:MAG: hypothetical protein EPO28_00115 [Saprospiraceae bacterium]